MTLKNGLVTREMPAPYRKTIGAWGEVANAMEGTKSVEELLAKEDRFGQWTPPKKESFAYGLPLSARNEAAGLVPEKH